MEDNFPQYLEKLKDVDAVPETQVGLLGKQEDLLSNNQLDKMLDCNSSIILNNQLFTDLSIRDAAEENSMLEDSFIDHMQEGNTEIKNSCSSIFDGFQKMSQTYKNQSERIKKLTAENQRLRDCVVRRDKYIQYIKKHYDDGLKDLTAYLNRSFKL